MKKFYLWGTSDDLIEVEGDQVGECSPRYNEDGTLCIDSPTEGQLWFTVRYDGTWTFTPRFPPYIDADEDTEYQFPRWPMVVRRSVKADLGGGESPAYAAGIEIDCPDDAGVFVTANQDDEFDSTEAFEKAVLERSAIPYPNTDRLILIKVK